VHKGSRSLCEIKIIDDAGCPSVSISVSEVIVTEGVQVERFLDKLKDTAEFVDSVRDMGLNIW
jgi:hypothetical protein